MDAIIILLVLALGMGGRKPAAKPNAPMPDEPAEPNAPTPDEPAKPNAPVPNPPVSKAYRYDGPIIDINGVPNYGLTVEELSSAKTVATRVANETYVVKPRNAGEVSELAGAAMTEPQALAMLAYWRLLGPNRYPRLPTLDKKLKPAEMELMRARYVRLELWFKFAMQP